MTFTEQAKAELKRIMDSATGDWDFTSEKEMKKFWNRLSQMQCMGICSVEEVKEVEMYYKELRRESMRKDMSRLERAFRAR